MNVRNINELKQYIERRVQIKIQENKNNPILYEYIITADSSNCDIDVTLIPDI